MGGFAFLLLLHQMLVSTMQIIIEKNYDAKLKNLDKES